MHIIEYRVRPVTRYIVTRWEGEKFEDLQQAIANQGQFSALTGNVTFPPSPKSTQHGEYDNAELAYAVAYALAKTEHDKLGYEPGDDRIQYPELPKGATGDGMRF